MLRQLFVSRRRWVLFCLLALLPAVPARAHFLWVAVGEKSPNAHLTFGETPDEKTPEDLVPKLAPARAWDGADHVLALTQGKGGWTGKTAAGSTTVAVTQSWGVVDFSGDGTGAFLLEYYAKGGTGLKETAADLKLPFEIFARQEAGQLVARVQLKGSPLPGSPVHVSLPGGRSLDLTSDAQGEVRFDPDGKGRYGLRARWINERKGQSEGKAYGEVRHYTTLTFALAKGGVARSASVAATVAAPAPAQAPRDGAAKPAKADPAAYALLKEAHDARQVMPPTFPGFRCDLVFQQGDDVFRGELVYRRQGETEVRLPGADAAALEWARGQILKLVGHRRGGDFAQGDGKYPLQLGPEDHNSYGRLILVNDDSQSSYRVRDHRVTEVTRTMEGSRFTISVIESMDADPGKYLANHFLVAYRDAATGALQKLEGFRDSYDHVQGVWLPTSRTVIEVSDKTSPVVRSLRFRNIEALTVAAQK
jgi:hypothetical protein